MNDVPPETRKIVGHHVKLVLRMKHPGVEQIVFELLIDGKPINLVQRLELVLDAHYAVPQLCITLIPDELDVSVEYDDSAVASQTP